MPLTCWRCCLLCWQHVVDPAVLQLHLWICVSTVDMRCIGWRLLASQLSRTNSVLLLVTTRCSKHGNTMLSTPPLGMLTQWVCPILENDNFHVSSVSRSLLFLPLWTCWPFLFWAPATPSACYCLLARRVVSWYWSGLLRSWCSLSVLLVSSFADTDNSLRVLPRANPGLVTWLSRNRLWAAIVALILENVEPLLDKRGCGESKRCWLSLWSTKCWHSQKIHKSKCWFPNCWTPSSAK